MEEKIFSEYGSKKLLMYADSFRQLANSFSEDTYRESDNREQQIKKFYFKESRQALMGNLSELSEILQKVAQETAIYVELPDKVRKRIIRLLGKERIHVTQIYYIEEKAAEKRMIRVNMCTEKTGGYTVGDVADMLSVIMDKRLTPCGINEHIIDKEDRSFFFIEEPPFFAVTGYARAVREQEKISGDNYSVLELDCGKMILLLSDGMGSGVRACKESSEVIERMETLLEAGHTVDGAMNIVNNTLLGDGERVNMSTLDVCSLDLYTGRCEFRKMGAAASFIKSNVYVEPIVISRLPLGIFFRNEEDTIVRELMDKDYLIMVTDGVLDAFGAGGYEEMLGQYLRDMSQCSPAEVAQRILQFALKCSGGHIRDDMTILVAEIFQNR